MTKKSFRGSGTVAAGGAGTETFVELWNAATTGVDLLVKKVHIKAAEDGGYMKIRYHTAQQGITALTSGNVELGGSSHSAALRGDAVAAVSGTQIGSLIVDANTRHEFEFPEPFVVAPGKSFVIDSPTAVKAITLISIEWDEVQHVS